MGLPLWDNPDRVQGSILPTYGNRFDLGSFEYPFRAVYAENGVVGSVSTGLTATGSTIADALALTASVNNFTTVAASTGAQLFDAQIGASISVKNLGANALLVYPEAALGTINALAAGAGFSIAAGASAVFYRVGTNGDDAGVWVTV